MLYHLSLYATDYMQKYNTHIVSCYEAIHLQTGFNHLWKWIDWMSIQCKLRLVSIQCEHKQYELIYFQCALFL